MPRRKKTFDYNDTFPKRLRQLISENLNITQDRLAEIVGVTRPVSYTHLILNRPAT